MVGAEDKVFHCILTHGRKKLHELSEYFRQAQSIHTHRIDSSTYHRPTSLHMNVPNQKVNQQMYDANQKVNQQMFDAII